MSNKVKKRSIVCPYCFNVFTNDQVLYQCESVERTSDGDYRCGRETTSEYDDYWRGEMLLHRHIIPVSPKCSLFGLGGVNLDPVRCDCCGYNSRRFVCPHCHNWLPSPMIEQGSEIISVIGGPSSGKTNYIVALMHELKRVGYKIKLSIAPQEVYREGHKDESTAAMFKQMEQMLFKEKTCLVKTPENSERSRIPWIFSLTNNKTQRSIYLVFYDTAGEHFQSQEAIMEMANYFSHSSGVIVLLDTLSVGAVKEVMKVRHPDAMDYESRTTFSEMIATLDTTLGHLRGKGVDLAKKPFAFAFSKFDMITRNQDAWATDVNWDELAGNSSFLTDGMVDIAKMDEVSRSIELLMENWGSNDFADDDVAATVNKIRGIWEDKATRKKNEEDNSNDNYKFFGVSAFGCIPREDLTIEQVRPTRVMDPLVWILHRLGGFDLPIVGGK